MKRINLPQTKIDELYAYCSIDTVTGEEAIVAFLTEDGTLLQGAFGPLSPGALHHLTSYARESATKTGRVVVLKKFTATETISLICPLCGRVSHNPHDVENQYCGHCHVFWGDEIERAAFLAAAERQG